MPNGDIQLIDRERFRVLFLDAQDASVDGVWVESSQYERKSFHADAIEAGGSIEIQGRNDLVLPANTVNGPVLITLVPGTLAGVDTNPWRWVKARKIAGGTPAVSTLVMEAKRPS